MSDNLATGNFVIRRVTLGDMQQVARLYVDSWQVTYSGIVPQWYLDKMTCPWAEDLWGEYIAVPDQLILGAFAASGEIAGFAAAQPGWDLPETAYLAALHVKKSCRGQGLGKRLIQAVARDFLHMGISRLGLSVIEGNQAALEIYLHLGAEKVDYRITCEGFPATEHILVWPDSSVLLKN